MSRKTFEHIDEQINIASSKLADKVLALHSSDFGLLTFNSENGIYVPCTRNIKLELDVLPILMYQKQYGLQKTRALLKPWIANIFALNPEPEALGFFRDDYGVAYLFNFKKTEQIIPERISIIRENEKLSIISPVKLKTT